jgi:plastocyanin
MAALPTAAVAQTKAVYSGGPAKFQTSLQKKYGAGVNGFLINRVTINVGDTVVWDAKSRSAGFHSVDFPRKGGAALPLLVGGATVNGVNDFAGNPFWFNGKVPSPSFNPALFTRTGGSTYNGSSRADSGLPVGKAKNFKLKFTKAGVYKYFCDVHHGMVGYVVVRNKGQSVPSATDDKATLAKEEATSAKTAKKLDTTKTTGTNVSIGASGPGGVEVFAMFPASLTVSTGTTVTFAMSKQTRDVHTATFGPPSSLTPLINSFAGPAPSPTAIYPSDPPGTVTLSSASHGNGFANTGALDRDAGRIAGHRLAGDPADGPIDRYGLTRPEESLSRRQHGLVLERGGRTGDRRTLTRLGDHLHRLGEIVGESVECIHRLTQPKDEHQRGMSGKLDVDVV